MLDGESTDSTDSEVRTTAEVARCAGISEGSIFNRYKSKDDLFRAAVATNLEASDWIAKLDARVGKGEIRDGVGKFSDVADISQIFGTYAEANASAGAGNSAGARAMTKGEVSLALTGKGTGVELGISFGKFIITRR